MSMADSQTPSIAVEAERFIYAETDLLDERNFDAWLALLTDDVTYVVPNFAEEDSVASQGVIVRENLMGLRARVARLTHVLNPTQKPPPRTRHFLTNVQVHANGGDTADVTSNLLLFVSKDGQLKQYPGRVEYKLKKSGKGFRIQEKKIYLITNDMPLAALPLM